MVICADPNMTDGLLEWRISRVKTQVCDDPSGPLTLLVQVTAEPSPTHVLIGPVLHGPEAPSVARA
jgi:hypothetical protein